MISRRAKIYARALFELAAEKQAVLDQLKELAQAFKAPETRVFFSPLISFEKKKAIIEDSLKDLPGSLKNFLFILIQRKALVLLPEIKDSFRELLNDSLGRLDGLLYSNRPLDEAEKTHLEKALEPFFKKTLRLKQTIKPLVGGVYIKAGDYVFNDTISFHLKKF